MDLNWLLAGGLFAGVIAAMWSRIKMLVSRITSLLIVTAVLEEEAGISVAFYLWKHHSRSKYGGRHYTAFSEYVRSRKRQEHVGCELPGPQPIVFWKGCRPVLLGVLTSKGDQTNIHEGTYSLTFLRGTYDLDQLIIDAMNEYNDFTRGFDSNSRRYKVFRKTGFRRRMSGDSGPRGDGMAYPSSPSRGGHYGSSPTTRPDRRPVGVTVDDIGQPIPDQPMDALAFPDDVWAVVDDIRRWHGSRGWYEQKRIPWRFGVLLHGKPGSGKSSLVRAVAQSLDMPVFLYDLATFSNADFAHEWEEMLGHGPCIALIEDIDAVFNGRENVTSGDDGMALTFDCLLNCISGVADSSGILVCITTNRVEMLDEALGIPDETGMSTRPGRMDRVVLLPDLDETARFKIANRILVDYPELIDAAVDDGQNDSGAQFEDRCARIALREFWTRKQGPSLNGTTHAQTLLDKIGRS